MKGELQTLAERLIQRYGSLRVASKQTKISHSGLAQIRDGKTQSPKPLTLQKLAQSLAEMEPPLVDDNGKPIRPTWIELQILVEQDRQDQEDPMAKLKALEAEIAHLRSQMGLQPCNCMTT